MYGRRSFDGLMRFLEDNAIVNYTSGELWCIMIEMFYLLISLLIFIKVYMSLFIYYINIMLILY